MMDGVPARPYRRSIRLPGYDYRTAGAYFVTVCTWRRYPRFGNIANGSIVLSRIGLIARKLWEEVPVHFPHVRLDEFIVMPDHVHGIIIIGEHPARDTAVSDAVRTWQRWPRGPGQGSLGAIVGSYKSAVTRATNRIRRPASTDLWQRDYYDRIIRSESSLRRIRQYIRNNPIRASS